MSENLEPREVMGELLRHLDTEQTLRAAVSGGAALSPREEGTTPYQSGELQRVAEAMGVTLSPRAAEAGTALGAWNTGPITFSGGVPVGGWANLSLFSGGSYNFSGHFHVSGAPSYNTAVVWGVKSRSGTIFTFAHSGRVHGTFESGSRDDDWNMSGSNPALAEDWPNLWASWSYRWEARVNFTLGSVLDDVKNLLGVVGAVIAVA